MKAHPVLVAEAVLVFCGKVPVDPALDPVALHVDLDGLYHPHRPVGMDGDIAVVIHYLFFRPGIHRI